MKRLFLMLITISSLTCAQPWNAQQNIAYKLPGKDKEKLDALSRAVQALQYVKESDREFRTHNAAYNENLKELIAQISRADKGMSLSGMVSSLSSKERVHALKTSLGYILSNYAQSPVFASPEIHNKIIRELSQIAIVDPKHVPAQNPQPTNTRKDTPPWMIAGTPASEAVSYTAGHIQLLLEFVQDDVMKDGPNGKLKNLSTSPFITETPAERHEERMKQFLYHTTESRQVIENLSKEFGASLMRRDSPLPISSVADATRFEGDRSIKNTLIGLRDAYKYILYDYVLAQPKGTYSPETQRIIVDKFAELISLTNLKLNKLQDNN